MKKSSLLLLTGLLALTAACSKKQTESDNACPGGADSFIIGQPFTLCYGTSASLEAGANLVVRFDALLDDSRCPSDVTCAWQGRADARLVTTLGSSQTDTLSAEGLTEAPVLDSALFSGYKIRLLAIEPYPVNATGPVPVEDYKLKLVVLQ
jgi:hypothetical protein